MGTRVISLTHVFPRGEGDVSATFLATWAETLRSAGHDVRIIAPHDQGRAEVDTVRGIPVRRVRYAGDGWERIAYRGQMHRIATRPPFGPLLLGAFGTEMASALRNGVQRWKPDLVHVHWWMPGAVITRMARVNTPTIVHLHGTDVALLEKRPQLATVARWALNDVNRIEAVSTSLAQRAEMVLDRTIDAVNPMPLAADQLAPDTGPVPAPGLEGPVILAVGRLVPEKGFMDAVHAVAGIGRPCTLRIVGTGPEAPSLRATANAVGVRIELPGSVPPTQLVEEYRHANVVVQPSYSEGFGLVAAEALLCGRPVVATDSGGPRDVLPAAMLVKPGDIDTLRARLVQALDNPDATAYATAALALRETLSPSAAVRRTVTGWKTVTG